MAEDKARDRVESGDSGRERNAVIRPQEPAADRMDFFNGLLSREVLTKGHACHFRCGAHGVEGLRIDVMGRIRGLANFNVLWKRRLEIVLPGVGPVPVMALEDLVRAKKTQRDKDWPMIRRLIEADYYQRSSRASEKKVLFWLAECRTLEILHACESVSESDW